MSPRRCLAAALAFAALVALPGAPADAGEGFSARVALQVLPASGETEAIGGVESWLRVTGGHSVVQGFTVWFKGLSLPDDGATLWMAPPGSFEFEEVAPLAVSANGSGFWTVYVDSSWEENAELPLGVESVLGLEGARVQVRRPGADLEDEPFLGGSIRDFRYGSLPGRTGSPGNRVKRVRLQRPPEPVVAPDSAARGAARLWRERRKGDLETLDQGLDLFGQGLTEDETYEVWIEDAAGEMVYIDETDSTSEGMALFSIDTRYGDTLPVEADAETVRDLSRRRIELRRTGRTEPSLVGLLPRIR